MPGHTDIAPRQRRRDARDNRDRVLAAARQRFRTEGLKASLAGVARDAGASIGTLYNHFPTRDALIDAALHERVAESVERAEAALRAPDPWTGLVEHLLWLAESQAGDRGFTDICVCSLPADSPIEQTKARGHILFQQLVRRAQDSGALRADVDTTDIGLLLWSGVRATEGIRAAAPEAWRRHLAIFLDGLRSGAAHPLPGAPLDPEQVRTAMALSQ
ncbi:TetR/AcrR family transcriptional regulator [Nocardia crassostreae]|uniref:TetR/AcrR family transcriptional regulator n=1 Tax=Nocardia crassostreae TaxID=53428 RepID=UPI0008339406|nr:TetR/AcrR family transcriptional regulator [Nocardia crassostreae]